MDNEDKLNGIVPSDETFILEPSAIDRLITRVTGKTKTAFIDYVRDDVIIPAAKDLLLDIVEGVLWGQTGRTAKHGYAFNRGGTNYTAFFGNNSTKRFYNKPTYPGYDEVSDCDIIDNANYTAVAFKNRGKAEEVLLNMRDRIDAVGYVTIGDFNDLTQRKGEFVDYDFGWHNLDNARVTRVGNNAYSIRFPKPVSIKS